jgi:hypothetical protein
MATVIINKWGEIPRVLAVLRATGAISTTRAAVGMTWVPITVTVKSAATTHRGPRSPTLAMSAWAPISAAPDDSMATPSGSMLAIRKTTFHSIAR